MEIVGINHLFWSILIIFGILCGRCYAETDSFVCEPGWNLGEASVGSCYRFASMEEMSHSDAVQACAAVGAALVVPSSQVEFDEFRDRTDVDQEEGGFSWSSVWIGCGDEEVEGMYACTDGTEIPENSGWWAFFQPDDYQDKEDCIAYVRAFRKLIDVDCEDFSAFALCEKPTQQLSSSPVLKESRLRRKYSPGSEFENYCLINHGIYTVNARSLGRCASTCSARDGCLSFTYEGAGICEMNDVTEEEVAGSDFVQRPGCVYYEKM